MFILLALSFYGHIKAIGIAMLIFTVKNILPLYDFEGRKEDMAPAAWSFLVLMKSALVVINIIFVNQIYDSTWCFLFVMLCTLSHVLGAAMAFYTAEDIMKAPNVLVHFFICPTIFIFVLYV